MQLNTLCLLMPSTTGRSALTLALGNAATPEQLHSCLRTPGQDFSMRSNQQSAHTVRRRTLFTQPPIIAGTIEFGKEIYFDRRYISLVRREEQEVRERVQHRYSNDTSVCYDLPEVPMSLSNDASDSTQQVTSTNAQSPIPASAPQARHSVKLSKRGYEDKNNAHKAKCKAVRATRDAEYIAALKRAQEAKKLAEAEEHRKREEYFTLHPKRPWHEQVGKSLIDTWTKLTSCCDPTKQHILD
eukprot:10336-Heterococcus_DN1.PRE.1